MGFWEGVADWGVPIASGLLRKHPIGMGIAAGFAAGGSIYKNVFKEGESFDGWSDVAAIGWDVGGSVFGTAAGPLFGKGMKYGLREMYKTAPAGNPAHKKLAEVGSAWIGNDAKNTITKRGMAYAGIGSGLGFHAREMFGGLPGSGSGQHVPIPTRPAGEATA